MEERKPVDARSQDFFGGTGSYPLFPKGWHLSSLDMPRNKPLTTPCVRKASIM